MANKTLRNTIPNQSCSLNNDANRVQVLPLNLVDEWAATPTPSLKNGDV